jgi:hypothetical protein
MGRAPIRTGVRHAWEAWIASTAWQLDAGRRRRGYRITLTPDAFFLQRTKDGRTGLVVETVALLWRLLMLTTGGDRDRHETVNRCRAFCPVNRGDQPSPELACLSAATSCGVDCWKPSRLEQRRFDF